MVPEYVVHAAHGPPQSIPVSPWFCIPSLHVGVGVVVVHFPAVHTCGLVHVPQFIVPLHPLFQFPQLYPSAWHVVGTHAASCFIVVNVVSCHLLSWQSHAVVPLVHVYTIR